MKTSLILIGKTNNKHFQASIDDYISRISHYMPFSLVTIPDIKNTKSLTEAQQKEKEGELILKQLSPSDTLVLLDEHGKEHTSVGFSQYLQKQMNAGTRTLAFVVGGAFGFAPSVYAAAHDKISLSQMTFNHQMVRLFFVEQLYRAFTILHHEPYHNA